MTTPALAIRRRPRYLHDVTTTRPAVRRRRHPKAGGRPKIDWGQAFILFAGDPTIGYADIADRFGVSDTAVRKHARPGGDYAEGWEERRRQLVAIANGRAEERVVRDLQRRRDDTVRVAELLRRRALLIDPDDQVALEALDVELAIRMLPVYAKLEELYAGEATDRLDVSEVRTVLAVVLRAAGRFVPKAQRPAFLEAVGDAAAGLVELGDAA